jgi:uncharacterized hydrophobic protein (TIGR00271 family)
VLALQLYVPITALPGVLTELTGQQGVGHVVQVGDTAGGELVLITADVAAGVVDSLLPRLMIAGVPGDEIAVVHGESSRPFGTSRQGDLPAWSGGALAWTELAMASKQYARAVPQYLVFMVCAGVIATFGILTSNTILVVGAMAISPDLLPLCATCVGIVDRRGRLALRAFAALVVGLGVASVAAYIVALLLRAGGYPPANGSLGDGGLGVLPSVNVATILVAFFAGIGGILSFETRSSSAVGVAISITTIPAAAFIGAATAVHDPDASGALAVQAANVTILLVAGSLTLFLQRIYQRRRT